MLTNKYKGFQYRLLIPVAILLLMTTSCKKFIEVDFPVTSNNGKVVYNTETQAIAVLTGIYSKMSSNNLINASILGLPLFTGLSSDEVALYDLNNAGFKSYYSNELSSQSSSGNFWSQIYPIIFVTNSAIEGLNSSTALSSQVKQQLLGEAKFIRAYCYFYLVNLYGDVPLALSTDVQVNSSLTRTNKSSVYQQIVVDLKDAQSLLSSDYLDGTLKKYTGVPEKLRPTKWAATSLLARVYLYTEKWANAETEANTVINSPLFSLDSLNGVFVKNSNEAIWQLQPVRSGAFSNTLEGAYFVLPSSGPSISKPVFLSNQVVNSFEANDLRGTKWVNNVMVSVSGVPTKFYYPFKYKVGQVNTSVKEYSMILRLGELYLIRAEARARQSNLSGAIADLDKIRNRAGLPLIAITNPTITQNALVNAILHEKQVELFTESGHRWLDLKRTNTVDAIMAPIAIAKGGTWQTTDQLYPIPLSELQKAPQLTQNLGY